MRLENTPQITIFLVYHSEKTKRFTEMNYEAAKKLNPGIEFRWVVGDNSPASLERKIDKNKFEVIEGFPVLPSAVPKWSYPSFFHTLALNKIVRTHLKNIESRFVLIIDADFLIVYPNWMKTITDYMLKNNLGFLGAPYHPRDYTKTRYFPSVVCMFIDTEKVDLNKADFRPQYESILRVLGGDFCRDSFLDKVFIKVRKFLAAHFGRRFKVRTSRDSGYYFYKTYYRQSRAGAECLTPVFKTRPSFWEKFLPDFLSFIPKKKNYFSETGFKELGYFDVGGRGLEEYLWKGKPFGFHFRGTFKSPMTEEEQVELAGEAVESLVTRNKA